MATSATFKGRDQVAQFYAGLFEGVPDATFELINAFVGEEGVVEESILRAQLALCLAFSHRAKLRCP
jgi:hypothetical protein